MEISRANKILRHVKKTIGAAICRVIGHDWVPTGGRMCPYITTRDNWCIVFNWYCHRCGVYHQPGEKGELTDNICNARFDCVTYKEAQTLAELSKGDH